MSVEVGLAIAVLVLLGNAFFVGAEFGLVSARRSKVELEALGGSRAARLTLSAMEDISLMLAAAQFGITICSLVLGAVGEPIIAHMLEGPFHSLGVPDDLLHPVSFVIALTIMVYLHVVIGEMVPKNLALASPTRTALLLTPPLLMFVKLLGPVVIGLNHVANACLRLFGVVPKQEVTSSFSRDEVAGFVKEAHREGLLSQDEEHLISGALSLDERTIQSVLLPREKLVIVSSKVTPAEIEEISVKTGYSRFPVQDDTGKLTGYVHLKDVLEIKDDQRHSRIQARYIWPLASLKAKASLRDALVIMQHSGAHLAQVTGPGNKSIGAVTLEDVLEELVGTIRDDTQKDK